MGGTMKEIHVELNTWHSSDSTSPAILAEVSNRGRHGRSRNKRLMQEIFAGVAKGDPMIFVERLSDDVTMTVTG